MPESPNRTPRRRAARPGLGVGSYRLVTLAVAAAAVIVAQAQLGTPKAEHALGQLLAAPDQSSASITAIAESPSVIDEARLAGVRDNAPFRSAEQGAWDATLRWATDSEPAPVAARVGYAALSSQPDIYRGRVVAVAGEVRRIETVKPAANDAGVEQLWRVVLAPEGGGVWPLFVYTTEQPEQHELPYPGWAQGVFFKKLSYPTADGVGVAPVIVAKTLRIGTAPDLVAATDAAPSVPERSFNTTDEAGASLGRDLLEQLGYDLPALDQVVDKQRLTAAEAPGFYALLGALRETPASQLARLATTGLKRHASAFRDTAPKTRRGRQTAAAVAKQFASGAYSVTPLFTTPERMRGELVRFDVVVRRVTPINCSASDVAAEHGVSRYYELEAFPEDSQNLPVVFCVRELPQGFPIGDSLRQPARLAGFFFKQWAYRTRKRDDATGGDKRQFAPLLIGRAPIPLATPSSDERPGLAIGVAGTVGLALLVAVLWRLSRRDRVHERQLLARYRSASDFDAGRLETLETAAPTDDAKLAHPLASVDEA